MNSNACASAGALITSAAIAILILIGTAGCQVPETAFLVRIENVSRNSLTPTSLAPGVFAVHDQSFKLFTSGAEDAGYGLETLAEDGDPSQLENYIQTASGVFDYGVFASPFQDDAVGILMPDEGAYEFSFIADINAQYLSFATMFVESNDLFFAPSDGGIKLFRLGAPVSGDVTRRVLLWDAYTEINEEPGQGTYQALRQTGPDSGPSETGPVSEVSDRFRYSDVDDLIRVTITPQ